MLAVPNMTVTAPKNGREMLGLLRAAVGAHERPFALRYPRDAAPDLPPAMSRDRGGAVSHVGSAAAGRAEGSRDPRGRNDGAAVARGRRSRSRRRACP